MKRFFFVFFITFIAGITVYVSYADEYGTEVEYVASSQSEYSITVPAKLTPKTGQSVSGTVNLNGKWASNEMVKITADETVVLENSLNPLNTLELDITLTGMSYAGNDTSEGAYTGTVTIEPMSSDILFGTWTGKFNYNVELVDYVVMIEFSTVYLGGLNGDEQYNMTLEAEAGMTWREWVESEYNTKGVYLNEAYMNGAIWFGSAGGLIDDKNNFVNPDYIIDPNAHYEIWNTTNGSPSFGTTRPNCPWI